MPLPSSQSTDAAYAGAPPSEAQVPMMERNDAAPAQAPDADGLTAKIYLVMGATTLLTFVTLRTGYELLFSQQLFG